MRLSVHVEGQTEELFVNELLASHLYGQGFSQIWARLYGRARKRGRGTAWPAVRREIVRHMKEDTTIIATTMADFEALLFSDCERFAIGIDRPDLASSFHEIRAAFPSPEAIDDSPVTAPSKRIEALVPGYEKPRLGALATREIGLETMRAECPHFDCWVSRLERRTA